MTTTLKSKSLLFFSSSAYVFELKFKNTTYKLLAGEIELYTQHAMYEVYAMRGREYITSVFQKK